MSRRPAFTAKARLHAALLQLGLDPETAELDHVPALGLRERTPDGGYIPAANDPHFLRWKTDDTHATKTFGPGGEKRITTAGSDVGTIAKLKRLEKDEAAFRERLLAKEAGEPRPEPAKRRRQWPKRKLQGRGFERPRP